MTEEERSALLSRQAELRAYVAALTQILSGHGQVMIALGQNLMISPQNIFLDAPPHGVRPIPEAMKGVISADWKKTERALDLRTIAGFLQDLRTAQAQLDQIDSRLIQ